MAGMHGVQILRKENVSGEEALGRRIEDSTNEVNFCQRTSMQCKNDDLLNRLLNRSVPALLARGQMRWIGARRCRPRRRMRSVFFVRRALLARRSRLGRLGLELATKRDVCLTCAIARAKSGHCDCFYCKAVDGIPGADAELKRLLRRQAARALSIESKCATCNIDKANVGFGHAY